jgi:hypothetical protein
MNSKKIIYVGKRSMTLLYKVPNNGPMVTNTITTTTAINTKIRAYSNNPWPFSGGGWYSTTTHLLSIIIRENR